MSGAVVLGAGGRLGMAGLVLVRGARPEFNAGGSLEVVLVGAFCGVAGGFAAPLLALVAPSLGARARGATVGLLVFGVMALASDAARGPAVGQGSLMIPVLAAAAAMCVGYGLALERLRERWEARR